jgi:hypothetical protein
MTMSVPREPFVERIDDKIAIADKMAEVVHRDEGTRHRLGRAMQSRDPDILRDAFRDFVAYVLDQEIARAPHPRPVDMRERDHAERIRARLLRRSTIAPRR